MTERPRKICVTKNGLAISGTEKTVNSMEGTAANYSDIQVSAGDVLRFEVSGDEVFWIPTAAYTDGGNKAEDADITPAAVTDLTVSEKTHNKAVLQWTRPDGMEPQAQPRNMKSVILQKTLPKKILPRRLG